jgi:hypothetical protein
MGSHTYGQCGLGRADALRYEEVVAPSRNAALQLCSIALMNNRQVKIKIHIRSW